MMWARENYKMKKSILDMKKSEASREKTKVTAKKEPAEETTDLTDPTLKFGIDIPDFTVSHGAHKKAIDWEKMITVDRLEHPKVSAKKEPAEETTDLTDPTLKFGIALPDFTASDRAHDKAIDWEKMITVDRLEHPSAPASTGLSPSDELIIDEALNGHGDVNDVIIRAGGDLVRRRSFATLRPRNINGED
jgi:hypothetical protein